MKGHQAPGVHLAWMRGLRYASHLPDEVGADIVQVAAGEEGVADRRPWSAEAGVQWAVLGPNFLRAGVI